MVGQYLELNKMITDYLVPNFTLRNKIQQGEWKYAFKPKYSKEYSYEKNIRKINFEIQKIVNPNLENFISEIVNREIRGKTYRRN